MKCWRCVFNDGAQYLILSTDRSSAMVSAQELYGSLPVNVFLEEEW